MDYASEAAELRSALVPIRHSNLYATSASFHHSIELLTSWLPLWIDAMARAADEYEVAAATAIRDWVGEAFRPTTDDDGVEHHG